MSDDLVKRARDQQTKWMTPILGQMADRIEELEAEVAHLTTENDEYARLASMYTGTGILRKRLKDRAALEAVKREVRNEALREAAAIIGVKVGHSGATQDCQCGMCAARREDHAEILELMEDTDDE